MLATKQKKMLKTLKTFKMTNKHTKGEWIAKDGQIYPAETGKTIALIPYFDEESEEQKANAKFIAAAPELLNWATHFAEELKQGRYLSQFELAELENLIYKATN